MKAHGRPRMRTWMLLVGGIGLVAGPVVLYYVLSHTTLSAAVVSGVIVLVLVVITHLGLLTVLLGPLYALLRRRSRQLKPSDRVACGRDMDPVYGKHREKIR